MRHCRYATVEAAMASKRGLSGGYEAVPCACGGARLVPAKPAAVALAGPPKRAPTDTGPDARTRKIILERDGWTCVRCGKPCGPGVAPYSLQHRVARGVGGGNDLFNLILLDGSALTECHGEVESRKYPADLTRGYRLESWQNPAIEPVAYFDQDYGHVLAWLDADGGMSFDPPALIAGADPGQQISEGGAAA